MIDNFDLSSFDSKSNCCGCKVCQEICPVNAIAMVEDSEGFIYPVINYEVCIECNKCEQTCPIINENKNDISENVYSCYSKDTTIRNDASSGGVFEMLSRNIIDDGGVVFGAAFDKDLTLKHMHAESVQNIKELCKSKYIQSDTNNSFAKVKSFLVENRKVMFVGTPCQVSALKNFLGKQYDNLLTIDFICHGVPSNKLFKSYIKNEEQYRKGKITSFSFRIKDGNVKHVHGYSYTIQKNGRTKTYKGMFFDNPFYFGFKKYLILRPSCYRCKYCTPDRVSDITLADFWGIEEYLSNVDFNKGISMILVNSTKGQTIFDKLNDNVETSQFSMDVAIKCNHCLSKPTKLPKNRDQVMKDYLNLSFDDFANKHIMSKKMVIYKIYYALPIFFRKRVIKIFKGISYV